MMNTETKEKELLSVKDMCELLDVSEVQFWRYRKKGLYPPFLKEPLRWRRSDILGHPQSTY
jgi:predicted DNA-binding transcriptional regulator AlpA